MSGVLVDDQKFVLIFQQPVSVKDLSDNTENRNLILYDFFFKQIGLGKDWRRLRFWFRFFLWCSRWMVLCFLTDLSKVPGVF